MKNNEKNNKAAGAKADINARTKASTKARAYPLWQIVPQSSAGIGSLNVLMPGL
ncbi:hypothetical protein [Rheinheimera sp.]|uniref:hypothetical protein n=1 Tax=Rheinheimera sp. TaxID=1869214 RepID=UPI002FDD65F0